MKRHGNCDSFSSWIGDPFLPILSSCKGNQRIEHGHIAWWQVGESNRFFYFEHEMKMKMD